MRKVRLEKQEELTLDDVKISDHLGFVDDDGDKGYFVNVGYCDGNPVYSAVDNLGESYFTYRENNLTEVSLYGSGCKIKELYKFDTRKELYKWLSK